MYKRAPFIVPITLKNNPYLICYKNFDDIKFPEGDIYAYTYDYTSKLLSYIHVVNGKITPNKIKGIQKIDFLFKNDRKNFDAFVKKLNPLDSVCKKLTDTEISNIKLATGHIANKIGIASKFLQGNFTTVEDYKKTVGSDKLANVMGAEKLFATMLMLGEYDANPNNIGVMIENDLPVYAKIDHGWSATQFFTSPKIALLSLANFFKKHGYNNIIPLNLAKLGEAIDQICCIDNDEIKELVLSRVLLLQQMKIDVTKLYCMN